MDSILTIKDNELFVLSELSNLAEATMRVAGYSKSSNTLNAYASDWEDFENWCKEKKLSSFPASYQTVSAYLVDRSENSWIGFVGRKRQLKEKQPLNPRSLIRRKAAIVFYHKKQGAFFESNHPLIADVLSGIRREKTTQEKQKDPLLLEDIRSMLDTLPNTLVGQRDKALLLLGFVSAMRRSELAKLSIEDLKFVDEGIEIYLSWSKTGQREIIIPYGSNPFTCPIRALKSWLMASNINQGYLFRSIDRHGKIKNTPLTGQAIALIIKRNAYIKKIVEEAQKDPTRSIPNYSGHSLRSGFVTTAALAGVPEHLIMEQTGHKKSDTVKKYIRIANKWKENATLKLGL